MHLAGRMQILCPGSTFFLLLLTGLLTVNALAAEVGRQAFRQAASLFFLASCDTLFDFVYLDRAIDLARIHPSFDSGAAI
jgi:hypothetical protein